MNELNEEALKARLKAIALDKKMTMNQIWKQLLLERFLARLSVSSYKNKFIFKGGMLLAQYIKINRETIDLDFSLTKLKAESEKIESSIREIAEKKIDDGFQFQWQSIKPLNQPHMDYGGFRISLHAEFKKMHDNIQIDVGIGDAVKPVENLFTSFQYKGTPIFSGEISLYVYPPESIFSEKLESIISRGIANSRMKDYHDLILMVRELGLLNLKKLSDAIHATFKNRNTIIKLPIQFDQKTIATLQEYWLNHLRGLSESARQLNFPVQISDVIFEINNFVLKIDL